VDAAGAAHSAQIVSHHVDDHEILGALLLELGQLVGECHVFRVGSAAGPGALHRPAFQAITLAAEEHLRREAEHLCVTEVKVSCVRDRLAYDEGEEIVQRVDDRFEGGIGLPCNRRVLFRRSWTQVVASPHRVVDLVGITGGDIAPHPGDGVVVRVAVDTQLGDHSGQRSLDVRDIQVVQQTPPVRRSDDGGGVRRVDRRPSQRRRIGSGRLHGEAESGARLVSEVAGDEVAAPLLHLDLVDQAGHVCQAVSDEDPLGLREDDRLVAGPRRRQPSTAACEDGSTHAAG
jgi:hypothetical protein